MSSLDREHVGTYLSTPALSPASSPAPDDTRDTTEAAGASVGDGLASEGTGKQKMPGKDDVAQIEGLGISSLPAAAHNEGMRQRTSSQRLTSPVTPGEVLKLSPAQIQELTSSPDSIPIRPATPLTGHTPAHDEHPQLAGNNPSGGRQQRDRALQSEGWDWTSGQKAPSGYHFPPRAFSFQNSGSSSRRVSPVATPPVGIDATLETRSPRPKPSHRTQSTPPNARHRSSSKVHGTSHSVKHRKPYDTMSPLPSIDTTMKSSQTHVASATSLRPSPVLSGQITPNSATQASPSIVDVPLPPLSLPTLLELELSSHGPSPLYIERRTSNVLPQESSEVKFERLMNFLLLWPELERLLFFGALTCVDAFLHTFTILPLRFFKASSLLVEWALSNLAREAKFVLGFVYEGIPRWRKNQGRAPSTPKHELQRLHSLQGQNVHGLPNGQADAHKRNDGQDANSAFGGRRATVGANSKHRRSRSTVSALRPSHKADLLNGLLIVVSSAVLLRFDASRMYHNIRGQNTIKLYLIFNVLEFGGKLLSAFGQDVLECLYSDAVLERDANGRSRILRPFCMFLLALVYNIGHSTMLFYQVVTLNVAVNSYSNALLSLLMSNQFVEIKGSVLKKIEKENLFQMTVGDICERFELWLMLTIIALRNLVEVGSLSISISSVLGSSKGASNATSAPLTSASILPNAFTVLPQWTGEVLGPFIIVLGSEMFVDYLKHAYITKFNNVKPNIYGRFLDVIAKDYYIHAFGEQSLTKRYGLPVLPLACLSIRAIFQTYHMFLATHMPLPMPSPATSISLESATPSATSALAHIDQMFRRALGRSTFGAGTAAEATSSSFSWWSIDDVIALGTMLAVFGICWLVLLAVKLALGMLLLRFARQRYATMKQRERVGVDVGSRRFGAWGAIEVDDEKRKWIYRDDEKGWQKLRERDERTRREVKEGKMPDLTNVKRYDMVGKRIW